MTRYFGVHTLEGEWHGLLPRYVLLSDRVQGKRILDIGCGTGIGSSLLLEMGAEQVNAIDHRPAVLELARVKHAKEGLDFHVMFWEELDFPDDSFDMVLCLDPTSPVTDPSLLLEIKRVLKSGGEYTCAIERHNIEGMESILPRYGYHGGGENVELTRTGERVPQLGELGQFFDTVVSVLQRPRYSFVFDFAGEEDNVEAQAMRKVSGSPDESGLWVGDDPEKESAEQTDQRPGRWIKSDERLCHRDGDPTAVELLFCGDSHMRAPVLREVQMPYLGLVERLHQIVSDLQVRQHPSQDLASFDDVVDRAPPEPEHSHDFSTREKTSEFRAFNQRPDQTDRGRQASQEPYDFAPGDGVARNQESAYGLSQIREQLDQMTHLYRDVRQEMENLFIRTREELVERDRYIEHLVDTVHQWQHKLYQSEGRPPERTSGFEAEPTRIFSRTLAEEAGVHSEQDLDDPPTTVFVVPDEADLDDDSDLARDSDAVLDALSEPSEDLAEESSGAEDSVAEEESIDEEPDDDSPEVDEDSSVEQKEEDDDLDEPSEPQTDKETTSVE